MDRQPARKLQHDDSRYWAIVPAAGMGRRMGGKVPKQYLRIDHRTILELTLERLHTIDALSRIVLALHPEDTSWPFLSLAHYANLVTVEGGAERAQSVYNALSFLREMAEDEDWVLVHDAVRPCVTTGDIHRLMSAVAEDSVGGILATPVPGTVKRGDDAGIITATVERDRLWLAATPQMFRYAVLLEALEKALEGPDPVTDEAAAVEALDLPVRIVHGRSDNIKLTYPEDLPLVEALWKQTEGL